MKIPIIQIGNSKGIRLSKAILDKYDITDSVELIFEDGYIMLKPNVKPRKGWGKAFQKMNKDGDDVLLISDFFENETLELWKF